MSTTLNHVALSRAELAQAREHADAGSTALANTHLKSAADHALRALDRVGDAPPAGGLNTGDFDAVQELIDDAVARPSAPLRPAVPMYGGPRAVRNARGAEAAERGLRRIGTALRRH